MDDIGKVMGALWKGLQALGGVGGLVGIGAFFWREKIKQSLAASMASRLERERASLALDHARLSSELAQTVETHKVTLIAEAERLKARQHLKTAIALRLAERKYTAACAVYDALAGLPPTARAFGLTDFFGDPAGFEERAKHVRDAYVAAVDTLKMNRAFILPELFNAGMMTARPVLEICRRRGSHAMPTITSDDPIIGELVSTFTEFERIFDRILSDFDAAA